MDGMTERQSDRKTLAFLELHLELKIFEDNIYKYLHMIHAQLSELDSHLPVNISMCLDVGTGEIVGHTEATLLLLLLSKNGNYNLEQ